MSSETVAATTQRILRPRTKSLLKLLLGLAMLAGLAIYADLTQVLALLWNVTPWVFAAAAAGFVLSIGGHVLRWQVALRSRGISLPLAKAVRLVLSGVFLNLFLPSAIGGDTVRILGVRKESASLLQATGIVVVERYCGILATFAMALVALLLSDFAGQHPRLAGLTVLLFVGLVSALFVAANRRVALACERLLLLLRLGKPADMMTRASTALRAFLARPGLLAGMVLLSVLMKIGVGVQVYFLAVGLGMELAVADVVVFLPLHTVVCALPISISGLGVREANTAAFFTQMGATPEQAASLAFLILIWVYVSSLPGAIFFCRPARSENKSERASVPAKRPATTGIDR